MLKKGRQRLVWTQAASSTYQELKERFTTAPILHHPDPEQEFIVEVDASSTDIGAVVSQRQVNPPKLYPCEFHSHKLTPIEQNYDGQSRTTSYEGSFWGGASLAQRSKAILYSVDRSSLPGISEIRQETPGRQDGVYSSHVLILLWNIAPARRTPRLMPCPDYMNHPCCHSPTTTLSPLPLYHPEKPAPRPRGRPRHRFPPRVMSCSQGGGSVTNLASVTPSDHHQR